jgi:hypothetical protein
MGGGYLLSFDVVEQIVSTARQLGFLRGGKWREAGLMPFMEDAFIGRLANLSGYPPDPRQLSFATRSALNSYKTRVQYPQHFCHSLLRPNAICNEMMSAAWCQMNDPLVLVHPVDIIHGAHFYASCNGTSAPLDHFAETNASDRPGSARRARRAGVSGHKYESAA